MLKHKNEWQWKWVCRRYISCFCSSKQTSIRTEARKWQRSRVELCCFSLYWFFFLSRHVWYLVHGAGDYLLFQNLIENASILFQMMKVNIFYDVMSCNISKWRLITHQCNSSFLGKMEQMWDGHWFRSWTWQSKPRKNNFNRMQWFIHEFMGSI